MINIADKSSKQWYAEYAATSMTGDHRSPPEARSLVA
jgi:hypothetical protein